MRTKSFKLVNIVTDILVTMTIMDVDSDGVPVERSLQSVKFKYDTTAYSFMREHMRFIEDKTWRTYHMGITSWQKPSSRTVLTQHRCPEQCSPFSPCLRVFLYVCNMTRPKHAVSILRDSLEHIRQGFSRGSYLYIWLVWMQWSYRQSRPLDPREQQKLIR
jgi:hypothetical protein